ncbi:MAG: tRNA 2-thiouridine(34) synthase MnmA [Minisyncoccia bacterium]
MRKKVVVAMSGGLDSSVAAALLKRAGFDVIGVFMKFWKSPDNRRLTDGWNRCCSPEAEVRARKVAKILKIPFYVFNFEKEFKERIVDYFLNGYKKGITPNPCVLCNKQIKFGLFLEKALSLDADYIATGHYTRKSELTRPTSPASELAGGRATYNLQLTTYKLLRAKDKEKDQSYFLWMLNQEQLSKILFPIGDYTRKEVEKLAKKFKLPVLKAKKSVELCFVQTKTEDFLRKYLKEKPGKIVDTEGKIIGEHRGLHFYTIGQRKKIGLPGGPYYVLDKNLKKNLLILTKNEKDLYKKELLCTNVNWILGKVPKLPFKIKAKIHYRHRPSLATIYKLSNDRYKIIFDKPQRAIIPGQSVVFYKSEEVLGGGIILL